MRCGKLFFLMWRGTHVTAVIPGRKGESVFYDNIFCLVLRVHGLSPYTFIFFSKKATIRVRGLSSYTFFFFEKSYEFAVLVRIFFFFQKKLRVCGLSS